VKNSQYIVFLGLISYPQFDYMVEG